MFIKRIYFWSLLLLCFVFGVVSGSVYETLASKEGKRPRRLRTSDMVKQIDLTPSQRAQLNIVLEESREKMVSLNKAFRPELAKVREETQAQIRKILTSAQSAKFDTLIAQQDRSRHLRMGQGNKKTKQAE